MTNIWNFIKRNAIWFVVGLTAILFLQPAIAEIKTLLIAVVAVCLVICLSGVAAFAYTQLDFTKDLGTGNNPGLIFLGVSIAVGLVTLGVYIAQFAN